MAPRESLSAEVAAMSDRLDRWLAGIEEEPGLGGARRGRGGVHAGTVFRDEASDEKNGF